MLSEPKLFCWSLLLGHRSNNMQKSLQQHANWYWHFGIMFWLRSKITKIEIILTIPFFYLFYLQNGIGLSVKLIFGILNKTYWNDSYKQNLWRWSSVFLVLSSQQSVIIYLIVYQICLTFEWTFRQMITTSIHLSLSTKNSSQQFQLQHSLTPRVY